MTTYNSQGVTIGRGDAASPEVFTTIAQVTSISGSGQSRGLIDVTNLASAAREYKKALQDGQEINLVIQYDPDDTTHSGLRTDFGAETSRNFKITLTDSPAQTISFAGMVTNWTLQEISVDTTLMLNVTIKPTGDLTYA
jgi:hypothetical protein